MGKNPKQYTQAFVARAVRLCSEAQRPIAEVARNLGVEYQTLYAWMKKAGKTNRRVDASSLQVTADGNPVPRTPEAMRAEIERLQRELDETKKQLEFAKKAAAFFAQQSK